ncbi:MAG: DUF5690 family protein [Fimbriiglobus sp.]|nr:DUF5690 family protein [Fimbriiglobus sp.]
MSGLLARAPLPVVVVFSMAVAFLTYFCMYAFRKPFDATEFTGRRFFGSFVELKTACVIAQVLGYCLSKYIGTRVCSEVSAARRGWLLLGLILWAGGALALFGVLPHDFKPLAMFLNGLPLGMVWGLCVRYLEGRRATELMIAGLSCSYVIAGAITRDLGRDLVMKQWGVPEDFMPVVTGALFLLPFALGVWLLGRLPAPAAADVAARGLRSEMSRTDRRAFLRHYGFGFAMLLAAYFFLTMFRDFRDHYGKEIFRTLGYADGKAIFTQTEWPAGFSVLAALGCLFLIRRHQAALAAVYAVIVGGFALVGVAATLYLSGVIDGFWMMLLFAVGLYLAYVPYGAMLFERMMAAGRFVGTAAFAIQLADGVGYTGSMIIQLLRDFAFGEFDRLWFVVRLGLVVSVAGVLLMGISGVLCVRRAKPTA